MKVRGSSLTKLQRAYTFYIYLWPFYFRKRKVWALTLGKHCSAIRLFFFWYFCFFYTVHSTVPPLGIQQQRQDSKCTNCCISSSALKWETLKKENLIDLHKRVFKCYSCFHSDTAINTDRIDWIWTHLTSLTLKTISFVLSNWNGLIERCKS